MSLQRVPAGPVGLLFATVRSVPGPVTRAVLAALLRQGAFLALPWFFAQGLADGIGRGDAAATLAWGGATLGAALVQWFAVTRWQRWANVADAASGAWLRSVLLAHVVRLAADALPAGDGDLLARATRDVLSVRRWVHGLGSWAAVVVTVAVVVPGLAAIDPRLLLTALACIPVLVAVNLFLPRRFQRASADLTLAHGRRTAAVAELLTSPVAVRGVGGEAELVRRHHAASRDLAGATRRAGATMATWSALTTGIPALATAIGLGVGAAAALDGRLSVADLTVFVTWMGTVGIAVEVAVDRIAATVEARVGAVRLLEVLGTAPRLTDPVDPVPLPEGGTVQLTGVSSSRDGRSGFIPPDLEIASGEFVVLTGPTGCGKSTLLELLARHRDPDRGRVTLAGTDVRAVALTDIRQRLVLVPQRPARLSGTLRQILALGRAVTDDDLLTACAAAGWEIDRGSLEAEVGAGATTFSGGQWQRLAVARALLARPAVLLLDDPTSAVDAATEQRMLHGVRAALPGATLVVASHRPAVLAAADRVVALAPPVVVPPSLQGVS